LLNETKTAIEELTEEVMAHFYAPGDAYTPIEAVGAGNYGRERALAAVRGRARDIRRALKQRSPARRYVNEYENKLLFVTYVTDTVRN
jgi:hypothetical protein